MLPQKGRGSPISTVCISGKLSYQLWAAELMMLTGNKQCRLVFRMANVKDLSFCIKLANLSRNQIL